MSMSKARLERVQLLRKQISDAALELGAMANDAPAGERRRSLRGAGLHAAHAALDLQAIVDRDAALPEAHAADEFHEDNCSLAAQEARRKESRKS